MTRLSMAYLAERKEAAPTDRVRAAWVGASAVGTGFLGFLLVSERGADLIAYYLVDPSDIYGRSTTIQSQAAFLYSPPMALVMAPLGSLPWPVVSVGWLALQLAALWYIAGRWALALILFPPVFADLAYGNINVFLAAMLVASRRYPAVWTFGLLTKVTPGVGLVWYAAREEWRALAVVGAVTAGAVAVSLAILGPQPWADWFAVLDAGTAHTPVNALLVPLVPRLALAAVLVAFAGRTDRWWLVPIAVTVAMPVLWAIAFVPLVALLKEREDA